MFFDQCCTGGKRTSAWVEDACMPGRAAAEAGSRVLPGKVPLEWEQGESRSPKQPVCADVSQHTQSL